MKYYRIKSVSNGNHSFPLYTTRAKASKGLMDYINDHNMDLDVDDDDYLTPFDFTLEEEEITDVNKVINNFETAREYLGGKPNKDFSVIKKKESPNELSLRDVTRLVQALNPSHIEALIALNELFTIAEAWNKADDFVPDFSNRNQYKYFPWFTYNDDAADFVCAATKYTATSAFAYLGSRLCFKSESRAKQFGKQFINLFNKVFLLKE